MISTNDNPGRFLRAGALALLLAATAAGQVAAGGGAPDGTVTQAGVARQAGAPHELPGGISIGATASLLPFNVLGSETIQTTTSDPVSGTTTASNSTSGPAGGGVSLELPIRSRFSILTGVLYRGASYTAGSETIEGEDDEDTTDVDERLYSSSLERTRASYWDIPMLVRFYDSPDRSKAFRPFVEAGGMFRFASGINTYREATSAEGETTTSETPAEPAHRRIFGATLGAGFRARAGGRVTLVPELRLTRWFSQTFLDEPTHSAKNQVEVVFSIVF